MYFMCVVCIVGLYYVFDVYKYYVCSMFIVDLVSMCVCYVCSAYDGSELCEHCIYM